MGCNVHAAYRCIALLRPRSIQKPAVSDRHGRQASHLSSLIVTSPLLQCHRRNEEGTDVVFPVNSIAYHPLYGTFATGGGDGVVNIWDGGNKKRLFQVRALSQEILSLYTGCLWNVQL
jgi:WD40 repeat protein